MGGLLGVGRLLEVWEHSLLQQNHRSSCSRWAYLVICVLVLKSRDLMERRTSMHPKYCKRRKKNRRHEPWGLARDTHILNFKSHDKAFFHFFKKAIMRGRCCRVLCRTVVSHITRHSVCIWVPALFPISASCQCTSLEAPSFWVKYLESYHTWAICIEL